MTFVLNPWPAKSHRHKPAKPKRTPEEIREIRRANMAAARLKRRKPE